MCAIGAGLFSLNDPVIDKLGSLCVPPDMEIHEENPIIDDDAVQDVTTAFNLQVSKCKMFIFSVTILMRFVRRYYGGAVALICVVSASELLCPHLFISSQLTYSLFGQPLMSFSELVIHSPHVDNT
jgi:hypothetical protein